MATEHFCLRWNNHQSTLISVFDNLLESGTLVDCTLAADGRYLKAHKVVLSACSPYLGMLLSQHYDKHPIIILKDVKYDELKAMLDYMYRGEVNISQEQLSTFLKAAETLQIKGLTDTGGDEGNGAPPNRPPSSNSTTSLPNDDPQSPAPPGEGRNSPTPKKRKRIKHSEESLDGESQSKVVLSDGSDRSARDSVSISGTPSNSNPLSALKNVSFGSVKREPSENDGDGQISVDESGDGTMSSRPGPSNGSGSKGSPWVLSADSTGEEMQLTPGQGPYMQNMMSMYGDMWMNSLNPMDMDQEMLAAYRFGRPNWNMNRYICTTCGRTYSLQASLYNHKKFECGKTPNFICPYCPHRTKQKGNLKTHIKKRHPEYFTEPFMPSPSRLNSMMNSIMMQNTMMQQSVMQNPHNPPTTQSSSSSMQNTSSPAAQLSRSYNQNPQSAAAMQNSLKSQNPSINNLLQAMKQQGVPSNSSNQNAISTASLVQALSQSLPNSTSISALDIMQVLAQGTPKSPMTPHRMSPMNASPASCNPAQSPISANKMSPINPSSANSNPPQSPLSANAAASMNGGVKTELPESPTELPSVTLDAPKSPAIPNFTTGLSLDPTESDDSSDTQILPSYPVTQ